MRYSRMDNKWFVCNGTVPFTENVYGYFLTMDCYMVEVLRVEIGVWEAFFYHNKTMVRKQEIRQLGIEIKGVCSNLSTAKKDAKKVLKEIINKKAGK